jgi:transcriptional regulator with XRE-family HTH domain
MHKWCEVKGDEGVALNAVQIFERVGQVLATSKAADIAAALGASSNTYSMWKARNKVPFEALCKLATRYGLSLDWLVFGVGAPSIAGGALDQELLSVVLTNLWSRFAKLADQVPRDYLATTAADIYERVAAVPDPQGRGETMEREISRHVAAMKSALDLVAGKGGARKR